MVAGCSKGPSYPGVVAEEVVEFVPWLKMLPQKFQQVICDDVIEHELPHVLNPGNNAFLL